MYKNSTVEALTELGAIRYGVVQPGKHFEGGIPILKSGDISNSRVNTSSEFRIAPDISSKYKRSILKGGEVLITLVGNPGIVAIASSDVEGFNVARAVGVLDVIRGVDRRFFSYALQGREAQQQINSLLNTTVQATLNLSDLKKIELPVPLLPDQKAIAHILGTLDDKIELNQKMNQTLEEIAKTIFKSWFVDFDPVRAKAEGRSTGLPTEISDMFPDELVDSEIGEIPKGWEVKTISDLADCLGGATPSTKNPDFWDGGDLTWTSPKDLSKLESIHLLKTDRKITELGLKKISSGLLPVGTVLLSSRAPVGYLALTTEPTAINQGYIALKPVSGVSNYFLLNWCDSNLEQIKNRASGTTFAEISKSAFRPIPAVSPSRELMTKFHEFVEPIYERMLCASKEVETLSNLRDTLLPKLISGELRIPDAEKFLEEAGI
jgi:type I restriction enzyme S subunit